jgi:hypothetical protein
MRRPPSFISRNATSFGSDGEFPGGRVVAVDGIGHARLGTEALKVAVPRIGEPDGPVRLHDHVVGRIERKPVAAVDQRLRHTGRQIETTYARWLDHRPLLANY